jgi:AcrR family transcriptional regulator
MIGSATSEWTHLLAAQHPRHPAGPPLRDKIGTRQADRRAAILAAARALFAEGGSDSLTLRRIAARSGSTVPTIYSIVGNRDAVVEQALLEHLETCINTAPMVAENLGLNIISGFSDTLWLSAQLQPAYVRRQVLLTRHEPDGRRLGALFVQFTTRAICVWVSSLCGRSRLAKRIGHEQIAAAIEAQLRTALLDWAEGYDSALTMRRKLALAPSICLARFIEEQEMARLTSWLKMLSDASLA